MAIKDNVSSNFRSMFIDCKEHFRLLPIRCGDMLSDFTHAEKDSFFFICPDMVLCN